MRLLALVTAAMLAASSGCSVGASLLGGHIDNPVQGEGVTGPVHAANVGKIVFSTRSIDRAAPDASSFATSFKDGERIYGRVYMPSAIANHFADQEGGLSRSRATGIEFRLVIDGQPSKAWSSSDRLDPEEAKKSTRQVWLNPGEEPGAARTHALQESARWAEFLGKLPPGKHTLRVEMYTTAGSFTSKTPGAVGELTLERGAGVARSGFGFAKLKAGMTAPDLERDALAAIQKHGDENGWKERFLKAKIESDAWAIERHPRTGVVTGRSLSVFLMLRYPDGRCAYRSFTLHQEHDGSGFVPPMRYAGMGSVSSLDCEE